MVIRILWRKYKEAKEKKGGAPPEPSVVEEMFRNISEYATGKVYEALRRKNIWWRAMPTPYAELFDLELRPQDEEMIREILSLEDGAYPLAGRLAYRLYKEGLIDKETVKRLAFHIGPVLEAFMFLKGVENEDEILTNPELFKEVVEAVEKLSKGVPVRIDNFMFTYHKKLEEIVPMYIYTDTRPQDPESVEAAKKVYAAILKYLERHPELKKLAREAKAAAAVAVRELKPPKAVNIILSKLEAAKEMAAWTGGVDIRALKKILYDVQERKKIVEEALRLVKEWEKGNKDAFFEGYMHLKNLPESELETHKLIGDIERIRRKVASGDLTPVDAANIFTALHTTYSLTESHLTNFLSRIEKHTTGEPLKALRIRPDHLDEHVIRPLREKLERIRPIVHGKL